MTEEQTQISQMNPPEAELTSRIYRKNKAPYPLKRVGNVRKSFPAIPVRGLWDRASEEDRGQAQYHTMTIMEYWLGFRSKKETEEELEMNPLQFHRLTQQAIAGMCSGLLEQPSFPRGLQLTNDLEIKKLKKRIQELERMVETQKQLIAILRTMPGCREAKLETTAKDTAAKVGPGSEKKNRSLAKGRSTRKDE